MLKFAVLRSGKTFHYIYTVTYCQTIEEVPWRLRLAKPKNQQKVSSNLKKIAKICHIKKLNAIPWQIKFFQ